jgi:uncharacterized damage-inducible protein DinB
MYGKRSDYNGAKHMRPTERLLEHLNRAWGGEAWYGPALRDLLEGVSEAQAKQKPVGGGHSIMELAAHIGTWMDAVAHRIATTEKVLTTVEDWPAHPTWTATLEELEHAQSRLVDAVARLSTDQLDQIVPGKKHSIYDDVLGVIEHNVYHAGQIAQLRRALGV